VYINGRVLNNPQILAGTQKIRDAALLEAAIARPMASAFGADAYPTLNDKVAALLHSVARNHPFTDGNKRTATVAAIFLFRVNGQRVMWQQAEALTVIVQTANGQRDIEQLAAWFPLAAGDAPLEADAARDAGIISEILDEQRWLLDELNRR
jgi:death-on-curing protein